MAIYNTTDQVTNFERGVIYWNSNVFTMATQGGGTGGTRALRLTAGASNFTIDTAQPYGGVFNFFRNLSTADASLVVLASTFSGASGIQYGMRVATAITQSSTAGYVALQVNATETTTGSGPKLLIDAQTSSVTKFSVDSAGNVNASGGVKTNDLSGFGVATPSATVDVSGSTTTAASLRLRSGVAPTSPNDGDIWFDGTSLKMRIGGATKTFTLA